MKKLTLVVLLLVPAIVLPKPHLYWATYCYRNHGGYPAYWTGIKSTDAQCEMRHVTTNGGAHRFWVPCRDIASNRYAADSVPKRNSGSTCNAER